MTVQFDLSWREYYEAEQFLLRQMGSFSIPFFRRLRLKQRWKRKPILSARHYVSFKSEGIHYSLDGIQSNLDWRYFHNWAESQDGFLLIYAEDVFNLIPKRVFSDEQALKEFRQLLTLKLRSPIFSALATNP